MNIQALYMLKQCLEDAASAGTDSIPGSPRLRRAVGAFAPVAASSPALGRIYREAGALLSAEPAERPARLLETLRLVLAAEREYGAADVPGELAPLEAGGGSCVQASFNQLQPLIAALTGTGGGRISIVEEAWASHPEYFGDSRMLPYLVGALGDAHGEWEELLGSILSAQGKRAVPFLKDGTDGRRGTERRIYWIARLAGAEENDWLLEALPESRDEARETLIAALGVSQDNAGLLRGLYRSESGKCRDAALRALARMEDEESRALWTQELERRPDCPPCLEGVDSALAADMAAQALYGAFSEALSREKQLLSQAELLTLAHTVYAAYGKYSGSMREVWLWCAERMDAFDGIRPDRDVSRWDLSAAEMLEKCLLETALWNPCEGVRALAQELGERCPARFLGAAVLTDLLTRPGKAFDRYGKYIVKNGLLRRENAIERANRIQIMRALGAVRYTREDGRHIPFSRKDALTGAPAAMLYRLPEFDPRWAETLCDAKVNRDGAVFDLKNAWSMTKLMFQTDWIE